MRRYAFTIGMALALGVTSLLLYGARLDDASGRDRSQPVLVFVIPDRDAAGRVARAIAPHRILWRGHAGLALRGGRVVSHDLDGAAEVIEQAGWVDATIRIVRLEPEVGSDARRGRARDDDARRARLRALVHAPALSRAEQLFVLNAMNDGLEF